VSDENEFVRRASPRPEGARPWRLGSQLYVAFFGGPLGAAAIGWFNGGRLGLSRSRSAVIVVIGAAGFLVTLALVVAIDAGSGRSPRLVMAGVGVACYVATRELQKPADTRYAVGRDQDAYDSLWLPGIATVIVCGLFTGVALAAAVAA
jgi:multisubunit Na+/H+ antiporter MnhB subunit